MPSRPQCLALNSVSCARLFKSRDALTDRRMPRTALHLERKSTEPDAVHSLLMEHARVTRRLGQGAHGEAFTLMTDDKRDTWVVKLPTLLLRGLRPPLPCRLGALLKETQRTADIEEAHAEFRQECRNAEALLDAPEVHALRMHHLHPVVHYDATVPMLLSLPAEGTAERLRCSPSEVDAWCAVARQLVAAVRFILDATKLAHLDIKPGNVFFAGAHCWLGDFGEVHPQKEPYDADIGTCYYNPGDRVVPDPDATLRDQSVFQCLATLMDLWLLPKTCLTEYEWNVSDSVVEQRSDFSALPLMVKTHVLGGMAKRLGPSLRDDHLEPLCVWLAAPTI